MAVPAQRLAILDVGHGNCAVLHDHAGVVVIDTGLGNALLEYLREQEIARVDLVLISHADEDHIGGLVALLTAEVVEVGRVCLNPDASQDSNIWNDLLYVLERAHNTGRSNFDPSLVRDNSGQYNHGRVHIEILAPSRYLAARGPGSTDRQGRGLSTNSASVVIRLSQESTPIAVFPGDVDEVGLDNLLENVTDVRAPVLIFPHHGGKGGSAPEVYVQKICRVFEPSTVVFSVARGRPKHPLPAVVALVRQHLKLVRIVCTQLTTHCAAVTPKANPIHLVPLFARGREKRACCGGTLIIPLNGVPDLLPSANAHQQFISTEAPTAMCR